MKPDGVSTRLQYDYCAAYLDFFNDEPLRARTIAARYADYPVERWRNAFAGLLNHLDEMDGKGVKVADAGDRANDLKLTWQAATGGSGGIARYNVFRNGVQIGSTPGGTTSFLDTKPPSAGRFS